MFSKSKSQNRIDSEQREQYEYARKRVKQKKRLMQHFIVFLAGSLLIIILNPILKMGQDFFIKDWWIYAILAWALLLLIHTFNVVFMNTFMDKEWEDRQLEKLKAKQAKRIEELEEELNSKMVVDASKKNETQDLPPLE